MAPVPSAPICRRSGPRPARSVEVGALRASSDRRSPGRAAAQAAWSGLRAGRWTAAFAVAVLAVLSTHASPRWRPCSARVRHRRSC